MPIAWLLSIGNEILIGRIVNTNAAWLAKKLTFMGFTVKRIITVPDDLNEIKEELARASQRADLVITTGGLGPTYDDKTAEAIAYSLNLEMEKNPEALRLVEKFYMEKNMKLTQERLKMAILPRGAIVFPNPVGAAPGFAIERDGFSVIALPGVPNEMKSIFENYVEDFLKKKFTLKRIFTEYCVKIIGVPESGLAPTINSVAKKYAGLVYLKSHPKGHETRGPILEIRALASGTKAEEASKLARKVLEDVIEEALRLGGKVGDIQERC
ncbi:MAG: nicotinamide mononucleotide deamidase-related protein [Desulfurococcales archaeon]|nr:nicotinamide mononucleotide deamidase-related protein [Desulfurococcales archaeon]